MTNNGMATDGLTTNIVGTDNYFERDGACFKGVRLLIRGNQNSVSIAPSATLRDLVIDIRGDGHNLRINEGCEIRGVISIVSAASRITIGRNSSFVNVRVTAGEGANIDIGADCLFSRNIEIRSTDEHGIYDLSSGQRINKADSVQIGDHVWIGEGVSVLKGVRIAGNCVVGARSLVTKSVLQGNSVIAGNPATVCRRNITWSRTRRDSLSPEDLAQWRHPDDSA